MKEFFNHIHEIRFASDRLGNPLHHQLPKTAEYKGRTYSLYKVYTHNFQFKERLSIFFDCLGKTLLSVGKSLFNEDFREKWQSAFTGRQIRVIYLPLEIPLQHSQTQARAVDLSQSIKQDQEDLSQLSQTLPLEEGLNPNLLNSETFSLNSQTSSQQTQSQTVNADSSEPLKQDQVNLGQLLQILPLEEGLNPHLLNVETKKVLRGFVQFWFNREDLLKPNWTVEELSKLLVVEKTALEDLFIRLQLFNSFTLPLSSHTLNWLFKSISDAVENKQRATMHWGVKMIWTPFTNALGKENRFPRGIDRVSWNPDELSLFLAVKKEVLASFLQNKGVYVNESGAYQSQEIDQALKEASNSEINGILEKNRTQQKSLRFAAD